MEKWSAIDVRSSPFSLMVRRKFDAAPRDAWGGRWRGLDRTRVTVLGQRCHQPANDCHPRPSVTVTILAAVT